MKKLKLVGILVAVVLTGGVISIPLINLRYICFAGWKIREAEILDIFAYKMSTKEVVSSVKHHGQKPEMKSIMK